jgi:hypothetical protein
MGISSGDFNIYFYNGNEMIKVDTNLRELKIIRYIEVEMKITLLDRIRLLFKGCK